VRIEQLEYVAAVARSGSFRRASEALHISQPALSESVRNLERELGITLLDRLPSGATVSRDGRDLLPYIRAAIDAVDRLRSAARTQPAAGRTVRVGTVGAATSPLVTPVIRRFFAQRPDAKVEVRVLQQDQIHRGLREGSLDLGLVNYLDGDDVAPELDSTELLRGHAVVCMRPDSTLAGKAVVAGSDLVDQPLVMMRSGYVMHRYVLRLLGGRAPGTAHYTDGADLGKLMVVEGLGVTILPDYSVIGDPLERAGTLTYRPIGEGRTGVTLVLHRHRPAPRPCAAAELHQMLVDHAGELTSATGAV
jgi:DNA-binding transcriptional LysR family regulator